MENSINNVWVELSDFECVGQIGIHCNWNQLCVYIKEQKNLFILPKIGYCLVKLIDENPEDEVISKLLNGGEFENKNGIKDYFFGLKKVLCHASYASYIFRHSSIDTPFGMVQKVNQDSLPVPLNELRSLKNEHYTNAIMYMDKFNAFLDTLRQEDILKDCFDNINKHCIKDDPETQRRQYSFANVEKYE